MTIEIVPRKVTVLPVDRQLFTVQPVAGLMTWLADSGDNATLQANGSVVATNPANPLNVVGAQHLVEGSGFYEWIIDQNCLPTSTGYLQVESFHGSENFQVKVKATGIDVSVGGTSATVSHTAVVGDRYRVVVDGQSHLYLNNVLIKETQPPFVSGEPTIFPVIITVVLNPPVNTSPPLRIPPMSLGGNWPLRDLIIDWTTPSFGSLATDPLGHYTTYFNGTTPGEYALNAKIKPTLSIGLVQEFNAIISMPPLARVGPLFVTLDPLQRVRFRTNYDDAQNDIVVWSVASGGGSFDAAHVYTAASAPGTSSLKATYTPQDVFWSVTVPAVITPSYIAVTPGEQVDWDTNVSAPTWTASAGSINSSSGIWTAPSVVGQVVRITATGAQTVTRDVTILDKFPYDPTAVIQVDYTKKVLISEAEDGSRAARVKNLAGRSQRKYELTFANRDLVEFAAAQVFWQANFPNQPIIFDDKARNVRVVGFIDSDIHCEVGAACDITYSFKFTEKA